MVKNREIIRRVTQMVIDKTLNPYMAAELLETSVRTISNYTKRYALHGALGLVDHRRGNYRKVTPETEKQIVQCKLQKPHRSAQWIRHWLKLDVSVETVRKVLVKHHLNSNGSNGSKAPQLRRIA
jgi:transposase